MRVDRRKHQRIVSDHETCVVSVDDQLFEGQVVDTSLSGLGIAGLDLLIMPYNKPVIVGRKGDRIPANVRYVRRERDHRFNIGVIRSSELTAAEVIEDSAMLINCYLDHQDWMVPCVPIAVEPEKVLVQLWDGLKFTASRGDLVSITRSERFDMLQDSRHLSNSMEMYEFDSISREIDKFRVFEHEFGYYKSCPISKSVESMMQLAERDAVN